ncbi:LysE/ArgO family amino acid transporter [Halopseudomonas salegens]|uniref:L-lysine exporter family protein LysE/ArgO n=1 Tax=Halopseudomonas salegens TaxID=1434072 RepID=A0A1H2DZX9_9GAMM|nr:LysE family transporter [Halopseudomonas salegens]SDT88406.1 L-lysine exporter family protein LysE/ArgO [Halopseudomonas salegens]
MGSFFSGLGITLSLIVAVGAQNTWVLTQSMFGQHRRLLAAICISCDSLLIISGIFALDTIQRLLPAVIPALTLAGSALLFWLGGQAALRAWRGQGSLTLEPSIQISSPGKLASATLAITLLNPHVYLDTVVLIGGVGAQQTSPWAYACGATLGSALWFGGLTAGAPLLARQLKTPRAWQVFDSLIALMLLALAGSLLVKVW